ncbi:MAG: endonuclease/exonuclease/phosphatase family protein [Treponema sp.]|jgi:endonuclease/exonuclease/phosphatase family metal-dependent hydrolase|nr:endonuclease/exonuclease/phosphatase family protein [Treponema sp.]
MKKIIKRVAAGIGIGIGSIIFLVVAFFGVLTIAEYRPAEIEKQEIQYHSGGAPQFSDASQSQVPALARPSVGIPFSLLSWNIGYASLDESQDFFLDGGKTIRPATDENVNRNLAGIREFIAGADCDVTLMQEADIASKRSYYINQRKFLTERFSGSSVFAYNFQSLLVPIPFPEIIGKVSSGLLTLSRFETTEAFRMSLPNPFSWPVRVANLKRCLLVSRIPLENSAAELVIVNLHLEAYDSSGGREAQTKALLDFLNSEYAKGNYCIAGGDFNQNFPGIDPERFAVKNSDYFIAGTLSPSLLAPGWQYAVDTQTPSCRLLNEPYSGNPEETQLYVIDGFILSPNVELVSVETFALDFKHSDHNPVKLKVTLK